jgi:hypothetical protein
MNPLQPSNPAHFSHRERQPGRLAAVFFLFFSLILTVRSSRGEEIGGPTRVTDHYATDSTVPPAPGLMQDTLPATACDMVGGQVTFTTVFSDSPTAVFQWQNISSGTTNDISGATNASLTLDNLQLADAAAYRLRAYP